MSVTANSAGPYVHGIHPWQVWARGEHNLVWVRTHVPALSVVFIWGVPLEYIGSDNMASGEQTEGWDNSKAHLQG